MFLRVEFFDCGLELDGELMAVARSIGMATLLSAALLLAACGQEGEAQRQGRACGDDARLAYDMTLRYVAGELGNPKHAEFPYLSEVRARKPDPDDPCAWMIYGYVDLKPESGAAEHRQYIMTIVYSGNNRWRVSGSSSLGLGWVLWAVVWQLQVLRS